MARGLSASLAPGHMDQAPFPTTESLSPPSQGSHLRSLPLPTPAARLGPRAQPQLSSSCSTPISAQGLAV